MKRLMAMLLALVMILSMIPMTAIPAFAEEYLISDEAPVEEPTEAPVEEPMEEAPVEEPAEESTEAPAEEPAEAPAQEPPKKYEGSGVCSGHVAGTVNGIDACLAEDGSLHICALNFPDANFRAYILEGNHYSEEESVDLVDTDGDGYLNSDELAKTYIYCFEMEISSLQGIGYFADLTNLNCHGNNLMELDVSANTALQQLYCRYNSLSTLDVSANTELLGLDCSDNSLSTLDVSANTELLSLACDHNSLSALDVSANTKLVSLRCTNNALDTLDVSANTALISLYCFENQLTALDVSKNTALTELSCGGNQLTALDVSKNTALNWLSCENNQLTALDVSKNTALTYLDCAYNQLTELDVSANTALTGLHCSENNLTELDISNNTKLTNFSCMYNQIAELDLSAHTELVVLQCVGSQMEELDVSACTKLEHLDCSGQNLSVLDVSNNPLLEVLYCSNTNITTLDVSQNTLLKELYCSSTKMTSLDVSNNTKLVDLICRGGELEELILPEGYGLQHLYCNGNNLTELDVSGVLNLEWIDVSNNDLTKLDLTNNTNLYSVVCYANALTQLDLPADADIQELVCNDQYWYGQLPLAVNAPEGVFVADLTGIVDVSKIVSIAGDGWAIDPEANIITFDYNPNEIGFTYEYATGYGDYTMTVNINVPMSGGDEPGGDESQVLIVPELDTMTQLTLGEPYVATWTGEDDYLWFYFQPEEDVFGTFLTQCDMPDNGEERIDPWAYLVGADGTVLTDNDDNISWNSGIAVSFMAGETYIFAVRARNNTGDLPVVIAEGDHTGESGGGSGGDAMEMPDFDTMTVLTLNEGVTQTWDGENYLWYIFQPEESFLGTFVTQADLSDPENSLDPYVLMLDAEGMVLNENHDWFDWNSMIAWEFVAGETYIYRVESSSGAIGELPVIIVEGDETGDFYDWEDLILQNAPALEDMTAMEPDTDYTASVENEDGAVWFTFTPAEDGYYAFSSGKEMTMENYSEPHAVQFATDGELLHYSNYTEDGNFVLAGELTAGTTYVYAVGVWGEASSFPVRIRQVADLTGISVEPVSLPEGSWSEYYPDEDWYDYYWREKAVVTLTFADGSTATGNGYYVYYEGIDYQVEWINSEGEDAWVEGGVYEVTLACQGFTADTTVTITENPIKSISVKDITLVENSRGYWDEYYNEEDGWGEFFHYNWMYAADITVTFKDGQKVDWNGDEYIAYGEDIFFVRSSDRQYSTPFRPGQTNTGYVYVGDMEAEVDITIRRVSEELAQVENLRVTSVGETSAKIAYDKVKGADRYEIYVNGNYWGSTTKTSYTIKGLTTGESYWITVAAAEKVDGEYLCGPFSYEEYVRPSKDISDCYIRLVEDSFIYDGNSKYPEVIVKTSSKGKELTFGEDYVLYYELNLDIGMGFVVVEGRGVYGNYAFEFFKIMPDQVTGLEITEYNHNSATITFDSVPGAAEYWIYKNGDRVAKITDTTYTFTGLSAGKTYKFSVRANTVAEELKYDEDEGFKTKSANFTGKASAEVSVKPVYRLEDCTAEVKYPAKAYTGKKITNSFTVKNVDGKTLKKDTDYTVSYENNVEMGIATAILKGKGKYVGELKVEFSIGPKAVKDVEVEVIDGTSVEVSFDEMTGAVVYCIYVDGERYEYTYEDECVITGLTAGKKHSITVSAGIAIGDGVVFGVQSKAVTVTPRYDLLECTSPELPDGYGYLYTGKSIKPAFVLYGLEGEVLAEGVDYTLSYKNNKSSGIATIKVTGKGRYKGTGEMYFYILPAAVKNLKISKTTTTSVKLSWSKTSSAKYYEIYEALLDSEGNVADYVYIGKTTGSSYTIKNLVAGEAHNYVVVASKDVKMFMYDEPWTAPLQTPSEVITAWAGTNISGYKVTLEYTEGIFTGEPLMPTVTVKTSSKSSAKTLVQDVDYTVWYHYNADPSMAFGKQKVTITGIGQYAGTITKTFTVVPPTVSNVQAEATGKKSISVTFDTPLDDYLGDYIENVEYWVYVNGSRKAKVTDGSCQISGLKAGKTYKITVRTVVNVDGTNVYSDYTDAVKVTTLK